MNDLAGRLKKRLDAFQFVYVKDTANIRCTAS